MRNGHAFGHIRRLAIGGALAISACAPITVDTSVAPANRPTQTQPNPFVPSESIELAAYYTRVQEGLVARGLLREDGGGPDTLFNARNLTDNFINIALFDEFTNRDGTLVQGANEALLHRWETPVRVAITFGATISTAQRRQDRADVAAYVNRLARVTGHPIRMVQTNPNFHVFVVNEAERRLMGPQLRDIFPGMPPSQQSAVTRMPRSDFCLVFASAPLNTGLYSQAVAVIRGEHPDRLRLSCFHEEIAQGLGLPNDSPQARPTIFNDDEEFGMLTGHDEMLLKILYDPRMRAGMTLQEARRTASVIAAELIGQKPVLN